MSAKILIVEDDVFIRDVIKELLEEEGYRIECAANGQEALDCLAQAQELPKFILLDLMMPIKDGFAFREEQLKDPKISKIPVVIMSADGNVMEKRNRANADEYLKKPLEMDALLAVAKKFSV